MDMKRPAIIPRMGRAAACVFMAAALCCGCSAAPNVFDAAQSAADALSSFAHEQPAQSESGTATLYDSSRLDDGKLRLLDGYYYNLGSDVLCGGTLIYSGKASDTLQLVYNSLNGETDYYLYGHSESSVPSRRVTSLCDKTGAEVMSFDSSVSFSLTGSILTVVNSDSSYEYGYISDNAGLRVFNLAAGQELAVPEDAIGCAVAGDYLAYTIYRLPDGTASLWEDEKPLAHCSVQVQDMAGNIVYTADGCMAYSLSNFDYTSSSPTDWLRLDYYTDENSEIPDHTAIYRPADGRLIADFDQLCSNYTVSVRTAGGRYQLIDLSGPEPAVLGEFEYEISEFMPGTVLLRDSDTAIYKLQNIATGEAFPIIGTSYYDNIMAACGMDGTLRVYNSASGELLWQAGTPFDSDSSNFYISAVSENYVLIKGTDSESLTLAYGPDGLIADLSAIAGRYNYISGIADTADGPLFAANYTGPNLSEMYDILDSRGNVLLHGLALCYNYNAELPEGCFLARRGYYYGWLDQTGQWLYCRSIFSGLTANDPTTYIYG